MNRVTRESLVNSIGKVKTLMSCRNLQLYTGIILDVKKGERTGETMVRMQIPKEEIIVIVRAK